MSTPETPARPATTTDQDEQQLAELGYKQELNRAWSGFTNFAISFTIISVLAGTWTTFGLAWNNGGPVTISFGWPIICALVLLVAVSMAELTSAFPTAGGPYWWAAKLGGAGWSWMTGWFNIVGLVGIVASVGYGAATFLNITLGVYGADIFGVNFADTKSVLGEQFGLYVLILILYTLINVFGDRLLALFNNISVGWHVLGVAVIIGLLVFLPDDHQSADFVFTEKLNNVGFGEGSLTSLAFWFLVVPQGFLLTMYTQTGYDASAHTAEETRGAAIAAAQGVWRSVFWSAVIGWFVLLALLFAASDPAAVNDAGGASNSIVTSALAGDMWAAKLILIIVTVGQLFCGAAGLTSASRTWYAFSRDRGMPGWWLFRRLTRGKVPAYAVIAVSVASLIIAIPALWSTDAAPTFPWAFFAITGICTVGLYIAYTIPIYLRLRKGDDFEAGPWTLGRRYRWINPAAIVWVIVAVVIFCLPFGAGERAVVRRVRRTGVQLHADGAGGRRASSRSGGSCPRRTSTPGPVRTLEEDEVTRD